MAQLRAVIRFRPRPTIPHALPMYHTFASLGVHADAAVDAGRSLFFVYPTRCNYNATDSIAYARDCNVLFAPAPSSAITARPGAIPMIFTHAVRHRGGEKLKPRSAALVSQFGLRVYEGYGATNAGRRCRSYALAFVPAAWALPVRDRVSHRAGARIEQGGVPMCAAT